MNRVHILFKLVICLSLITPALAQQPTSNSSYFEVTDYMAPGDGGIWRHSDIRGYTEQGGSSSQASILILPQIYFRTSDIRFYDEQGGVFDPVIDPERLVRAAEIKPQFIRDLPTPVQMPGLAGAVFGKEQKFPLLDVMRMGDGTPARDGQVYAFGPALAGTVDASIMNYLNSRKEQEELVRQLDGYQLRPVAIQGVKISLRLDGVVLAERVFTGSFVTSTQTLPALTVLRPDGYTSRRLAEGGGEIEVAFRFNDSKVRLIDAQFDTALFVKSFVDIHQRMVTRNSSSGFSIFGLSFRRNSIRQSINQQVEANFTSDQIERTKVITLDATDDMISRFEAAFFPTLSLQEVIANHLAKAEEAASAGNTQLEQLHMDYAKSLQDGVKLDEPDMAAAAAALAAQDYASFLAAGVRAGFDKNSNTATYRRLDKRETTIEQSRSWLDVQRVTVARELNYVVSAEQGPELNAWLGACNVAVHQFQRMRGCNINFPQVVNESGILLTCVVGGGPLADAGIAPGAILMAMDGDEVPNMQKFRQVLNRQRPNDRVSLRFFDANPNVQCPGFRYGDVTLGAAPSLD